MLCYIPGPIIGSSFFLLDTIWHYVGLTLYVVWNLRAFSVPWHILWLPETGKGNFIAFFRSIVVISPLKSLVVSLRAQYLYSFSMIAVYVFLNNE